MGLFSKKSKGGFLGVDIGASGVKLVELEAQNGRAKLYTYAYADRDPGAQDKNPFDDPAATGALIKSMLAKCKARSTRAAASVDMAHVFSSIITVQETDPKKVKDAVEVQARKLMSLPLEQMYVDTKVLDKKDKFTTVLVTGAPNTQVSQITKTFEAAGLKLSALEPESFALVRALVGKDLAPVIIADIGAVSTNIIIADRGIPVVSRTAGVGGLLVTRAAGAAAGVGLLEAERIKVDAPASAPAENVVRTLANEIQYLLQNYREQHLDSRPVEKIVLTGGSGRLPGLADALSKAAGVRGYLGDPWARVLYAAELRPLLDEIGPRFPVAVGLAMREIV